MNVYKQWKHHRTRYAKKKLNPRSDTKTFSKKEKDVGDYFFYHLISDLESLKLYAGVPNKKCGRLNENPGASFNLAVENVLYQSTSADILS